MLELASNLIRNRLGGTEVPLDHPSDQKIWAIPPDQLTERERQLLYPEEEPLPQKPVPSVEPASPETRQLPLK